MKRPKGRFVSWLVCGSACLVVVSATHVFAQQQVVQSPPAPSPPAPSAQQNQPKQSPYDERKDADRKKLFKMNTVDRNGNGTIIKTTSDRTAARALRNKPDGVTQAEILERIERDITECFTFRIKYDSASVRYLLDNLCLNGKQVLSENTEDRQRMITQPCQVQGGDTLSFFRSVSWHNVELFKRSRWPTSREAAAKMSELDHDELQMRHALQSATCYQAYHELAWTVELVSSTSGKRLLLLDSLKFEAQPSPRAPAMQLQAPPVAQIRYVVPASLSRQQAFVRIVPYARATPASHIPAFKTHQNVVLGSDFRRDLEEDPALQMFLQTIMTATMQTIDLAEINRTELQAASDRAATSVTVAPNPSSGPVSITLNAPSSLVQSSAGHSAAQRYTLVVYNAAGQAQWTWLNAEPSQAFTFRAAAAGAYYVVAYDAHNHTVLRSQSFIIQP
jgi:hypothetical protein